MSSKGPQIKEAAGEALSGGPMNDTHDRPTGVLPVSRSDVVPARTSMIYPISPPSLERAALTEVDVLRHEFGNSLGVVLNALAVLRKKTAGLAAKDTEVADLLAMFGEEFDTMGHLIKRFNPENGSDSPSLAEEIAEYQPIDLSEILQAEVKLWRRLLRLNIRILRFIAQDVKIQGDHCELHEIVHNLFKNAVQAMQSLPEDARRIFVTLREHDDYVQVLIQDNGPGIPEEAFPKLFQIGHTSKKGGRGIGLYQAQRLAGKMGGVITLVNNADREDDLAEGSEKRGATAVIELPKIL